jgi:hypothetical protein
MPRWRVGHKVPINVYDRDRPVCQCHNEEDAREIVEAMNMHYRLTAWLADKWGFIDTLKQPAVHIQEYEAGDLELEIKD